VSDARSWEKVVSAYKKGHLIAYPTEGVWGLGCDPFSKAAVYRLLALKERPVSKGLIVIAADWEVCADWVDSAFLSSSSMPTPDWSVPQTWVFPASALVPAWIRGEHSGVALRVTKHPVAAEIARQCGGVICSTSANLSGEPAIKDEQTLREQTFASECVIVSGDLGGLTSPTPIYDAVTGASLRL